MKYQVQNRGERAGLLLSLREMPEYLVACFGALSSEDAIRRGPDNGFSPV